MALYDEYEQFRDPSLTPGEQALLAAAADKDDLFLRAQDYLWDKVPGGFRSRNSSEAEPMFRYSRVVEAHMQIAVERAEAQFQGLPVMAEDLDAAIRYPGIDPTGKYGMIDMKFAQREAAVRARIESQDPIVKEHVNRLLAALHGGRGLPHEVAYDDSKMKQAAREHRQLTRASKLCLDPFGRKLLHQKARALESDRAVVEYDQLMQGFEYACGIRTGPIPKEISDVCRVNLNGLLDPHIVELAQAVDLDHLPGAIAIEFHNLENKMLQRAFSNPRNWGKSLDQLQDSARQLVDLDKPDPITPYARATANRVLDPIFDKAEGNTGFEVNRGDLIIIDGKTVRERMLEDYVKAHGDPGGFEAFYGKNLKSLTSEYVAAGLMAGKRVEAFVPDEKGNLPQEPSQIVGSGYTPSPLKAEHFNAWQRFFSRHGFYKAKVARQQEYEQTMAARERVREKAEPRHQLERAGRLKEAAALAEHYSTSAHKDLFFGPILDELGFKTTEADGAEHYDWGRMNSYMTEHFHATAAFRQFTRSEPMDTCVNYLAAQGHSFRDIMDPTKLQAERLAAARLFMEKAATNDTEWLGQVYYAGHKALLQQAEALTHGIDLQSDRQLIKVIPEAEGLLHSAFSVSQVLGNDSCSLGYYKAALADAASGGDLERASQMAFDLNSKVCDAGLFAGELLTGVKAQATLSDPATRVSGGVAADLGTMRLILDHMKKGASIVEKAPTSEALIGFRIAAGTNEPLRHAVDNAAGTPEARVSLAKAAAGGKLLEQLRTKEFRVDPALDKKGQPIMNTEVKKILQQGEDGSYCITRTMVPHSLTTSSVDFELGGLLAPAAERKAPQQVQQKQPHHSQKQPPQLGGASR